MTIIQTFIGSFGNTTPPSLREAGAITQVTVSDSVLSLTKPSSTQTGDLMVAFGVIRVSTATWSMPSGWTEVLDHQYAGGGNGNTTTFIAYKTATSSEPSSYSFTSSVSNNEMSGVIVTYQNAAFDTVGSVGEGNVSNVQTAPSINVAVNDSVLLAFFAEDDGNRSWSNATSGLTKIVSDETANGGPAWALYEDDLYPSGASGNKQATCSGGGNIAVLLSLKLPPTSTL